MRPSCKDGSSAHFICHPWAQHFNLAGGYCQHAKKTSHTISNQISRACLEILQDQIAFTPIIIAGSTEKRCYAGYPIRVIVLPEIQWNKWT